MRMQNTTEGSCQDGEDDLGPPNDTFRFRRVLHPWRITAFCAIAAVLLIAVFFAGRMVQSPNNQAISNAQLTVPVTVPIEQRPVEESLLLRGSVVRGQSIEIVHGVGDHRVITDLGVTTGDSIAPGTYLGSISGSPVFVMNNDVPLYRDLVLNDSGADVALLQRALHDMGFVGVAETGKVDAVTLEAVRLIYSGDGLSTPGQTSRDTVFRWQDFVQVPGGSGQVVSLARVADLVDEESPMMTIQSRPNAVVVRATVLQADLLKVGTTVTVRAGDQTFDGLVQSVGDYTASENPVNPAPGKDVIIEIPGQFQKSLSPEQPVTVGTNSNSEDDIAIPLIAIRQDGAGSYVEVLAENKNSSTGNGAASPEIVSQRVNVTITEQAAGWVAIEPVEDLPMGTQVLVP